MDIGRRVYVDDRDYPGGPSAYIVAIFTTKFDLTANVILVMSVIFGDALLVRSSCRSAFIADTVV